MGGTSLVPFVVFVGVYLGSGIVLEYLGIPMAFYQFPAPLAAVLGIVVAFALLKGKFEEKFDTFVAGCGDINILIMCIIYLLAGGFAAVCKAMGGIDSTVNIGLTFIPAEYLSAGIFIITAFIVTATGTSVGSVVAMGPIAIAIAEKTGIALPLILGCVMFIHLSRAYSVRSADANYYRFYFRQGFTLGYFTLYLVFVFIGFVCCQLDFYSLC